MPAGALWASLRSGSAGIRVLLSGYTCPAQHWPRLLLHGLVGGRPWLCRARLPKSARPSSGCFVPAFGSAPLKPTREVCDDLNLVAVARQR